MALSLLCFESVLFFTVFSVVLQPTDLTVGGALGRFHAPAAAILLSSCWVGALYYAGLYDRHSVHRFSTCLMRAARAGTIVVAPILLLGAVLFPSGMVGWSRILAAATVTVGMVLMNRTAWHHLTHRPPFVEQVVVLGKTPLARAVIAELQARRDYRVLDDEHGRFARPVKGGVPLLRPHDRRQSGEPRPHRIVVALSERRGRLPVDALLEAKRQGIAVEDGLHLYERLTGTVAIETLQPSQVIFAPEFDPSTFHDRAARAVSLLAAGIGLLLCAPLLGCIAVLVKLDSKGPVLFVQDRIGRDGRRFQLMKFRTMRPVEERRSEWVKDNGDRITRIGRWLRKFRLDELPQLFNVLVGHMNLVGPRPHPASNYELFTERIPFYAFRSMVRPGITGWAQVRYGYANDLEEETEKMRYDLYYIKHRSLLFDLDILLRTVKVVLLGRDAKLERASAPAEGLLEERTDAA